MILLEIRDYVKEQGQVSLQDAAVKFDLPEETAAQMLAHWEKKGKIVQAEKTCGACCSCSQKTNRSCRTVYLWKES
ncbi:MAG: hypothetical protein IJ752_03935 [Alphaproteobacteria bacterium]|nr:hypothetical protein [Alphaproteobacteria bacterium]